MLGNCGTLLINFYMDMMNILYTNNYSIVVMSRCLCFSWQLILCFLACNALSLCQIPSNCHKVSYTIKQPKEFSAFRLGFLTANLETRFKT